MQKILVITGPTATGKSDLAVVLAQRFDGEIVSADSRQVYKGMDIGTGKITRKEMRGIPHHMLDVVSPKTAYNAAKYRTAARRAIADILRRGKLPIIVGGSGFWIDAILSEQEFPDVKPDKALRSKLAGWPAAKLLSKLRKLDPQRAATIADPQNPVRLIRAIEIAVATKDTKRKIRKVAAQNSYSPLFIGLDVPDDRLRSNIARRLKKRLRQGMADEASGLHAKGVSWKRMEAFGLEYRSMVQLLRDHMPTGEVERLLNLAIWHYAKRQRTWFRKNKKINWIDATDTNQAIASAVALTEAFMDK